MLTKKELGEQSNKYVLFSGFSDQEALVQNNNESTRTDWHSFYFLYNKILHCDYDPIYLYNIYQIE